MTKHLKFPPHLPCLAVAFLILFASPGVRAQSFGENYPSGVSAPGGADAGFNFNPYTGGVSRTVSDLKIDGSVSAYGLTFSRTFFTRRDSKLESVAPATFFGGYWRHSFQWDVVPHYSTAQPTDNYPDYFSVYFPDGRIVMFPVKQNVNNSSSLPTAFPYDLKLNPRNGIKERFVADDLLVNTSLSQNKTTAFHVILGDGGRINGHIAMGPSKHYTAQDGSTRTSYR